MNIRDLTYFLAVVDLKHFGKAAEACYVSQPALSMQLKKMEEDLGVQLFERNNKQVIVTPIGKTIAERARLIIKEVGNIRDLAKQASDPLGGIIKIGVIPTIAPYLLPRILPRLQTELPNLQIQLIEAQTPTICRQLEDGELDLILLALPLPDYRFVERELYLEPFFLAVPHSHALAHRQMVSQQDLANESVLLLEDGHCLRDQALAVCKVVGAREKTSFRATSLETLRHMVASGAGITLVPEMAVSGNASNVVYLPFSHPVPNRSVGLAWRPTTARSYLFHRIGDIVREITHQNQV